MQRFLAGLVAMVVCSAIVSTGVFLGLKNQTVVQVIAPPAAKVEQGEPATAVVAVDTGVEQRIATQARRLMEERRAALARDCKPTADEKVSLELRMIFNAKGKLISYAVNDPPEASHLAIAKCVREHRPVLSVEGGGQPATVQFFLTI